MNSIDVAQNIKSSVPLVLFIHFYFDAFLNANTLYSIISDVLPIVTRTSILRSLPPSKTSNESGCSYSCSGCYTFKSRQRHSIKSIRFPVRLQHAEIISRKFTL
jgi:hypothetical protein